MARLLEMSSLSGELYTVVDHVKAQGEVLELRGHRPDYVGPAATRITRAHSRRASHLLAQLNDVY